MPKLPIVSGLETVKALSNTSDSLWIASEQSCSPQESHPQGERGCVIPMHKEVALGTLRSALKLAGVSPEEFTEAL